MIKDRQQKNRGFTLIEIMVSVSIFLIMVTVSMGAILGVFTANRKARSMKAAMNNLTLTIDTISREMRFGINYHCSNQGTDTAPRDCPAGSTYVSFLSQDARQITYQLNGAAIEKRVGSGSFVPITGPEIVVQSLQFYVIGSEKGDGLQPKALMLVKGYADTNIKTKTTFILQTLISQRQLDL
jgi:prepilin-type N-terminal cleavage/methylation domain-containing protein